MRVSDWSSDVGSSDLTVSKVINQITMGVAPSTRERVEAAVRHLGYRPNRVGRGLRTLRRSIIGMAIVDPSPSFLADPFTTNLVAGLTNHLSSRGFGLLLHGVKPRSEEHTSELQSLMRISYAVFCLKKKKNTHITKQQYPTQTTLKITIQLQKHI